MQKKLFLIDAYAMIYRAYYAFIKNPRLTSKGFNTSAIFGFVTMLEDLLKREQPEFICVAFDPSGTTFRHEAFEQYKAQRPKTPEDIKAAVPYIKEIVEALGIKRFEIEGFEADDVIGTIAKQCQRLGFTSYMVTPDKDYAQLVDNNIYQYKPIYGSTGFDILGIEEVKNKYAISHPLQMIDLLGLMGDTADNIPGCPGVGEKTAQKLLEEFGSIEKILENTDKIKGKLQEKIVSNREMILFSRFLAEIRTDVPLVYSEEYLRRNPIDRKRIIEIFSELEFRTLSKRILGEELPEKPNIQKPQAPTLFDKQEFNTEEIKEEPIPTSFSSIDTVPHHYHLIETLEEMKDLAEKLSKSKAFCFDTETTSLDIMEACLVGMSFAIEPKEAYFVAIPEDRAEAKKALSIFHNVFEDSAIRKIGQNMKYDISILANYGIEVKGEMFDTMIAHYLLQPELRHNMDYMAEVFLGYTTIHFDDLFTNKPKGKNTNFDLRSIPINRLKDYACEDADITLRLANILEKKVEEEGLHRLFYEIEMPLVEILSKMERNGVLIDDFALSYSAESLKGELSKIETEIAKYSDERINISSPRQIGELLFDKLKIVEKPKKTKTGQYQTDEETLQKLRFTHKVVDLILQYRGIKKLLSTYIEALPKLINQKTGKIHTSYNQTVVATGRLSSSNPNLQNIPVRDEQGREIRKAFIAEDGYHILSADYSQVELRIMAHLSDDKNMIAAFLSGEDIHTATAAKIFHCPLSGVTPDMRRKAKTANFGIIYGISAFGLAERLSIPRREAAELIDGYFASFPAVKLYMEQSIDKAREKGYAETIFGRKRYLSDISSRNANIRQFAERNAINAPIQGTAADIIKIAMNNIDSEISSRGLKSQMIMQVHDELVFSVPDSELGTMKTLIKDSMEAATSLKVPLISEVGVGKNWLEAH